LGRTWVLSFVTPALLGRPGRELLRSNP
jgi:hypothetical protein